MPHVGGQSVTAAGTGRTIMDERASDFRIRNAQFVTMSSVSCSQQTRFQLNPNTILCANANVYNQTIYKGDSGILLMVYSWFTFDVFIVYSWFTHGLLMVYSWITHGLLMVYSWFTHGVLMGFSWFTHGLLMVYSWFTHDLLLINTRLSHDLVTTYSWSTITANCLLLTNIWNL